MKVRDQNKTDDTAQTGWKQKFGKKHYMMQTAFTKNLEWLLISDNIDFKSRNSRQRSIFHNY